MIFIQWTKGAFADLETPPQTIAFRVVRNTDYLSEFPEMGTRMKRRHRRFKNLRQIVVGRYWRVIYDFDETEEIIFVLRIQNCRQKLPTTQELERRRKDL